MTHDEIITAIPKTARALNQIADRLSDEQLRQRRNDGHWSFKEVIGHLRDVAAVYNERIQVIGQVANATLAPFDPEKLVAAGGYNSLPAARMIAELEGLERSITQLLSGLDEAGWQRGGVHPTRGTLTIEQLASNYVEHANDHVDDLWERIGSC